MIECPQVPSKKSASIIYSYIIFLRNVLISSADIYYRLRLHFIYINIKALYLCAMYDVKKFWKCPWLYKSLLIYFYKHPKIFEYSQFVDKYYLILLLNLYFFIIPWIIKNMRIFVHININIFLILIHTLSVFIQVLLFSNPTDSTQPKREPKHATVRGFKRQDHIHIIWIYFYKMFSFPLQHTYTQNNVF